MRFAELPITESDSFPPADSAGSCWIYVTLNAEIALSFDRNAALRHIAASPRARISVDGQWLWWALRRKYPGRQLRKLSGSDLIHAAAVDCARRSRRLLLLGSTPERNAAAVLALRRRHPSLAVSGYAPPLHDGDCPATIEAEILAAVDADHPDYIVLGFGADKEHALAWTLCRALDGRVRGICCFGGAIDLAGGSVRRAPALWQQSGLEGVYRVWQQPRRLLRLLRVLRVLPVLVSGRY